MVLGYTRTGRPVLLPTRSEPDKAKIADWTRGDHVDASRILMEHGEREPDPKVASWCTHWSSVHWDAGRRPRSSARVRGAAETLIRPLGLRRKH